MPGLDGAWLGPITLALIACGTLGGLVFTSIYLVEGATRPGYSAWAQPISALSLGPTGWLQRADFVVFGLVVIASAVGWRLALMGGAGAMAYPVLRLVEGIGLIVDGVFSQDSARGYTQGAIAASPTLQGQIHSTFAFFTIAAMTTGWFVLAHRFASEPLWRRQAAYAAIAGVLTVLFIALFGAMGADGGMAGLFERLATGVGSLVSFAILARLVIQALGAVSPRSRARLDPVH